MIALRLKGHDGSNRPRLVNKIQTRTEKSRQRIRKRQPLLIRLLIRLRVQIRPQLNTRAALAGAIPRPSPPALRIPPSQGKSQVQLARARILKDLAQRSGEEAEVVRLKVGEGGVGLEVEAGEEL